MSALPVRNGRFIFHGAKNASGDAKSCQCEPSRFIEEMKLDEGDAPPKEDEIITPKDRLANLKALLQKPKAA